MAEQLLNVVFKEHDGIEVCEIRAPGDREAVKVFPAHVFHRWTKDAFGNQVQETYAQRWNEQYRRFKEKVTQLQDGTPLKEAPFITLAKANELRALGFHVLEQVAAADGRNLKMMGQGGRGLKDQAAEFLAGRVDPEVLALRKRVAELEGQKNEPTPVDEGGPDDEDEPGDVSTPDDSDEKEALKLEIADLTGARPRGNPSVETLRETLSDLKGQ